MDPATKTLRQLPAIDIRYVETLFLLGVPGARQSPGRYCPLLLGCAEGVGTLCSYVLSLLNAAPGPEIFSPG